MPNYKPRNHTMVGADALSIPINNPENIRVIVFHNNLGTAVKTLKHHGYLSYQVPSGKKFRAVTIWLDTNASAAYVDIYESTTVNGTTTHLSRYTQGVVQQHRVYPCDMTFAEDMYVTFAPSTNHLYMIMILGYEY